MSHQPERKEKDCLNCGTIVQGRYCHVCGQENIQTHQTFLSLSRHFVYDVFHFDGKFFDTLSILLFKPGKIVREYVNGKRASFLDPIRMYLFTSAVFFIIFFAFTDPGKTLIVNTGDILLSRSDRLELAHTLNTSGKADDTLIKRQIDFLLDTSYTIMMDDKFDPKDADDSSFLIRFNNKDYLMTPRAEKNGISSKGNASWADRKLEEKWKRYKRKHGDDLNAIIADFSNTLAHRFPYLLFLSLPFFAMILKLLYVRRKILYGDHAVFTLYHYIFSFIIMLVGIGILALYNWTKWELLQTVLIILFFIWCLYLLISMKRFYAQGWLKTIFKFLVLNFLSAIVMLLLLTGFIFYSIYQL